MTFTRDDKWNGKVKLRESTALGHHKFHCDEALGEVFAMGVKILEYEVYI